MSETELTERCRVGDNTARKELYEQYAGQMFGICYRYAGDREIAQDLLHDGFLKAYCSFDKFTYRGEGSLKAWLSRVMVNISLDYLRKNDPARQMLPLDQIPESIEEPREEDITQVPHKVLMKFIAELPSGYRTVFNLYVMEQLSHKEIAEKLGINEKSSSSQLFRAKKVLAKEINNYLKENNQ
ncbi:RNA polymerase sigma-70 factor, ECF subfamily [Bacteroides luti]|jgi:RNA polymerase sigma-70 factor (ECF subfamily)|uniref:RNA polymerase sigma-70 factor, ECF subfamily n=1 Tax=Bacteroides luti TaxID=1297750 RepID=A0A1M4UZ35_9BACE|nr:sigma-70 family RNA polymerase sigma factor [Bacteroides luti]SHE61893.1 RNA polymerase sigma-70 factor, ECF subfamily [Bacteroides luti]